MDSQHSPKRPLYRLPDGALTPEEIALIGQRDPVDGEAVLAWLEGNGPDPWQT